MLCSNKANITFSPLCTTKQHKYTFFLPFFGGFSERKLQNCVFCFLYTFLSDRLHVTPGEMLNNIFMGLDISDIYGNPLTRNNFI